MSELRDDGYLWDRSGSPDPQVAALESLLGRFGHEASLRRRSRRRLGLIGSLAAAAVLALALLLLLDRSNTRGFELVRGDGAALAAGDRLAGSSTATRLRIDRLAEVELAPRGSLRIVEAGPERTRLFLEHGRLAVSVDPAAAPRFFQVETPAALCVDLGCRYELEVDAGGETLVRVDAGQVALESGGGSRYVPQGAEARARPGGWLGTPRFRDASSGLQYVLDAYDEALASGDRREDIAEKLAAVARSERDTLPLWQLLSDPDPDVVRSAERTLVRIAGLPPQVRAQKMASRIDPAVWREHLAPLWRAR